MAMRSRRIRLNRAVAAGIGLLLVASAVALSPAGWPWGQRATEKVALGAASPFLRATASVHTFSRSIWEPMMGSGQLREENARLRESVARMTVEKTELERQLQEATGRLALSEMPRGMGLKCIPAPVLANGPAPRSRTVVIGRGAADGIQPNMAVLSPPGVAGVVRRVTEHQALVQLVVDTRSQWGATLGRENTSGLVQGTGDWHQLVFLFENDTGEPAPGETVSTSGIAGSLFPSGLPIGVVEGVRFDKNGRRVADLRPLAQLVAPEELYVILGSPPVVEPALRKTP